jgi:hypothetical protein
MTNIDFHAFKNRKGFWVVRCTLNTRGRRHWYTTPCDSLEIAMQAAGMMAEREMNR